MSGHVGGDDRVELCPEQFLVGAEQFEELSPVLGSTLVPLGCIAFTAAGQALIACRSAPLLLIAILRGLACSATGIFSVSTPES